MSQISYPEYSERIVIHPDKLQGLTVLIFILHGLAMLLLFFVDLNFLFLMILAGLILYSLRRHHNSERSLYHGISLQPGERLFFQVDKNTDWSDAEIIESFVSRWLIVIKIQTQLDSKRHSMVVTRDSISCQQFRRLVVYLNYYESSD